MLWFKKAAPPYFQTTTNPNNMYTFRGLPTIFGSPTCNDNGFCATNRVIQYDPVADEWSYMADMSTARLYHEVIEVPRSFCFGIPTVPPESTTDEPISTTDDSSDGPTSTDGQDTTTQDSADSTTTDDDSTGETDDDTSTTAGPNTSTTSTTTTTTEGEGSGDSATTMNVSIALVRMSLF